MTTGILLAVALAAWALLAHPAEPGGPVAAALIALGIVTWTLGALSARLRPALPGLAVAGLVSVAMVLGLPGSMTGSATAPPLGYANANAALLTAGVAGLLTAASAVAVRPRERKFLYATSALLTLACVVTGSLAGVVASLLVIIVWPVTHRGRVLSWQLASGCLIGTVLATSVALGVQHDSQTPTTTPMTSTLSEARIALWSDALDMAVDHPVAGVGPGAFPSESPTARLDPDHAWPHSTPLRTLAELGFVGLALLISLVVWMIHQLGRASVVLAALALQPMVDYVLTFPAVIVAFSLILGSLTANRATRTRTTRPQLTRTS